jgi:thioesterase domain-containing protein
MSIYNWSQEAAITVLRLRSVQPIEWKHSPLLKGLPEEALPYYVAAQLLPERSSKGTLASVVEQLRRQLAASRHCVFASFIFVHMVERFHSPSSDAPAVFMTLAADRSKFFHDTFHQMPHIRRLQVLGDALDKYGPATTLRLPGEHIPVCNACLAGCVPVFTDALGHFLGDASADEWWLGAKLVDFHKDMEPELATHRLATPQTSFTGGRTTLNPTRSAKEATTVYDETQNMADERSQEVHMLSLQDVEEHNIWEVATTGAVRGPLGSSLLIYIPGSPGVCFLEFTNFVRLLPGTIVGIPYARDTRQATLPGLAEVVVKRVLKLRAAGQPLRLMGHSFGAILASLVVRRLEAMGHTVEALILLDPARISYSPPPTSVTVASASFQDYLRTFPPEMHIPHEDLIASFREILAMIAAAHEELGSESALTIRAPTLVLHAQDSLPGFAIVRSGTVDGTHSYTTQHELMRRAVEREACSEWRMSKRWYSRLHEFIVQGDHLSFLTDHALASQSTRVIRAFVDASEDGQPAASVLGSNFNVSDVVHVIDAKAQMWYEYDLRWQRLEPIFPWADNVNEAVAIWASSVAAPSVKKEVQYALLVIDTVLLWHHTPPTECVAPPLSAYRTYQPNGLMSITWSRGYTLHS